MPSRRITLKTSRLPERETAICRRLKEVRERLEVDQIAVARRLGVKREFISAIEKFRAPVRYDIGLRFCREFVVSEEWLATGGFAALDASAGKRFKSAADEPNFLHEIFIRHCFDLWSLDITRTIPPRALFSTAFDNYLAPFNAEIAEQHLYGPRLLPNPHDGLDISRTLLNAHLDGRLFLLANQALALGGSSLDVQRSFLRAVFETSEVLWKRFMGFETPEILWPDLQFLRDVVSDTKSQIGPLAITAKKLPRTKPTQRKSRTPKK